MILLFLLNVFITVIEAIFGILPSVPATPDAIVSGGDWVINSIATVRSVLSLVYGDTLLIAIFVVVIGIFSFDSIYRLVMWVLHKLPVLNVR